MRPTTITRFSCSVMLLTVVCTFTPTSAFAQDTSRYRATVYGFVPNLSGETAFPTPLGSTIDIDAETLLENTDFALMGLFEVQNQRWGAFTDVMYFNVGTTRNGTRDIAIGGAPIPLPITANASLDIEAWVVMAAANFRAASGRAGNLDIFGGTRRLEATSSLGYTFSSPVGPFAGASIAGTSEATNGNWDGIGGVRGRLNVGTFVVPYYADAGAGESDLTWQVMAGIGYAFRHMEVGAVWRHLDYRMKSDRTIADLAFDGPTAGVTFKW